MSGPPFLRGNKVALYAKHGGAPTDDREVSRFMSRGAWPGNVEPTDGEVVLDIRVPRSHETPEDSVALSAGFLSKSIGITGLHNIAWIPRSAEFRILIGEKSAWGEGYGTEATMLMCSYAFEILNLHKVWLGVVEDNIGAVKVYHRVGFTEEGILRDEVYRNREYYDALRMSMLRSEYDRLRNGWPICDVLDEQFPQVGGTHG